MKKIELQERRARRTRYKIRQSVSDAARKGLERYRFSAHISNNYIYAQVIDDIRGVTLASCSSIDKAFGEKLSKNAESAAKVGAALGEKLLAGNIMHLVFDKGHRRYGKRLAALVDAVREKGINV